MRNLLAMFLLIVNIVSSPLTCKASDSQSPQRSNTLSNETWAFMNTPIGALLRLRNRHNETGGVRRSEANPVAITVPDASDPNFYQAWGQAARMPQLTSEQRARREQLIDAFSSAQKVKDEKEKVEYEKGRPERERLARLERERLERERLERERLERERLERLQRLNLRLKRNSDGEIQVPDQDFSGEVFDPSLGSFRRANFSGCNLQGAVFLEGCVLQYVNFSRADLCGTLLPPGSRRDSSYRCMNLLGIRFDPSTRFPLDMYGCSADPGLKDYLSFRGHNLGDTSTHTGR